MLTLVLGGARSGKSRLAQNLAATAPRVAYIATAQAGDDAEMASRIAHHRASRPSRWLTIEAPLALADAVERANGEVGAVIVDCLTVWLSNLFWAHRDEGAAQAEAVAREDICRIATAARTGRVILVSNEVGSGPVPEHAVTRAFRDAQGLLNQRAAELADEVILTVAGLPLYLKKPSESTL
jgi:adenosylcobinamide kinase/adenosylcobinamide-phosphate guanylyltransferase